MAALSTFPSVDGAWMLHDLDVRFVVTPTPIDPAAWPNAGSASALEA